MVGKNVRHGAFLKYGLIVCLLFLGLVVSPGMIAGVIASQPLGDVAQGQLVFMNDFSDDEVGKSPQGWRLFGSEETIQVVEDSGTDSGKAVRIVSDPSRTSTQIAAAFLDVPAAESDTIVIEHKIKWIEGKNNLYVSRDNRHFLHWWVDDSGELAVRVGSRSRSLGVSLKEGWNRIGLVANRATNQFFIYLNDREEPVAGPFEFREVPDTWAGASLIFSFSHTEGQYKEMYIGDISAWAITE